MKIALIMESTGISDEQLAKLAEKFVWDNTLLINKADLFEIRLSDRNPQTEVRLVRKIKCVL